MPTSRGRSRHSPTSSPCPTPPSTAPPCSLPYRARTACPDGSSQLLSAAIGRSYGLDPDRIICGAGSDEILNFLAHVYLGPGDEAIMTRHCFLVYPIATLGNGAKPVIVAENNFTADVDAILAAVTPRTRMVWLANPNNPTGTYLPFDQVKRLQRALPANVLLVVDAAYADYAWR